MIETGLQGKVVIVTGAAAGIGKATAQRFAAEGCRVASWDVREEEPTRGGLFRKVDVTDAAQVEAAVEEVAAHWGGVHVLVNNAGIIRDGQLIKYKDGVLAGVMSDAQFDSLIGVNLKGVFICTRAAAPRIIAAGGGVILNASSVVGLYGNFADELRGVQGGRDRDDEGVGERVGEISHSGECCSAGIHRYRYDEGDAGEDPCRVAGAYASGPNGAAGGYRQRLCVAGVGRGVVHQRYGA